MNNVCETIDIADDNRCFWSTEFVETTEGYYAAYHYEYFPSYDEISGEELNYFDWKYGCSDLSRDNSTIYERWFSAQQIIWCEVDVDSDNEYPY